MSYFFKKWVIFSSFLIFYYFWAKKTIQIWTFKLVSSSSDKFELVKNSDPIEIKAIVMLIFVTYCSTKKLIVRTIKYTVRALRVRCLKQRLESFEKL